MTGGSALDLLFQPQLGRDGPYGGQTLASVARSRSYPGGSGPCNQAAAAASTAVTIVVVVVVRLRLPFKWESR